MRVLHEGSVLPTRPHVGSSVSECCRELLFLVKASRPGFWLTAIWFYLLPVGSQASTKQAMPTSYSFWLGLFYVAFPLGLIIYAANDLTDVRTDKLNPRKDSFLFGARPTASQITGLPLRIALVQLPFIGLFWWLLGPRVLVWFCGVVGITSFYNFFAKNRPVFDTLAQVGYLAVFVLTIWLNKIALPTWQFWVFGALFAMHSHLFGEIMDIEPDRLAERRTTAVAIGARATKVVICSLLIVETVLATSIVAKPWLPYMLAFGAVCFAADACFLWRERAYPTSLVTLFFLGWNLFLLLEIGATLFLQPG